MINWKGGTKNFQSPDSDVRYSTLLTEPSTHFPRCVLVLYPSDVHTYDQQTGPFQPARLIIHGNGDWCLQCPIYEHTVVESRKLETNEASRLFDRTWTCLRLRGDHTLCPGVLEDFKELGYIPKSVNNNSKNNNSYIITLQYPSG